MKNYIRLTVSLAATLAMAGAFAQAQTGDADQTTIDGNPVTPVAYVYVSTSNGINLYDAASNGHLTEVSGSPFHTTLPMIGSNGSHFFTLDYTDFATIHSYSVASNGAIGSQVSSINSQNHTGVDCGSPDGAVLDHTGQNIYVLLDTSGNCGAYQTYGIGKTTGVLSFKGAAVNNNIQLNDCCSVPAVTESNKFAYSQEQTFYCDGCYTTWGEFKIVNGVLENSSSGVTGPTPKTSTQFLAPFLVATDNSDHVAVLGSWYDNNAGQYTGAGGFASYTVNSSTGALHSTNTWKQMPVPNVGAVSEIRMSPSGKILAVAGSNGLQLFHFNGAAPLTAFGGLLTKTEIDHVKWDTDNHLYALSDAYNMYASPNGKAELYEYTVTPTSVAAVSGAPVHIAGANGLVVVAK